QVRDALARRDGRTLSGSDARAVALDLGAGRYVRGEVSHIGDSVRVYAALYDVTRGGSFVRDGTMKLGSKLAKAEAAFANLGEQLLSNALLALGGGEVDRACRVWTRLTVVDPYDFASWYGLGNCLSRDDAVQRDPTTASGWRFRSSYQQAIRAYVHAFQLLPS